MRSRLLPVLLALPLLAFDCGGKEQVEVSPFGLICRLQIRGAAAGVNEDLWCIVSAYDYADLGNPNMWVFELVAYRDMTQVGGAVGIFLPSRPALGTAYGWTASTTSVDSGDALRAIGDVTANPSTYQETHHALSPQLSTSGVGSMSVAFSRIPPQGAVGQQLTDVHGTLSGTLVAEDGKSPPLTFAATF